MRTRTLTRGGEQDGRGGHRGDNEDKPGETLAFFVYGGLIAGFTWCWRITSSFGDG